METDWAHVATIDAIHADVVRELLADAGIAVRFTPWQPPVQLDVPPLVPRPRLELHVEAGRRDEAVRLMAEFTAAGEEAVEAEAESTPPPPGAPPASGPLWRRALHWLLGHPGDEGHGPHA